MSRQAAVLSLGTRKDATTWEKGCRSLGFGVPGPIKKGSPSLDELRAFFRAKPSWLYLGGHFSSSELYNEDRSVGVEFRETSVRLVAGAQSVELKKGTADFCLDANCDVVLWGGCSVCSSESTIRTMRLLFGQHLLLGFAGLTGWRMVDAMLGGGFIKADASFFGRLRERDISADVVRDAWMTTARFGYGGGGNESKFRAIDPNGQEWRLQDGKIVRGRKIS